MMNKKKSSNIGIVKYALFMPLLAGLLFVNSLYAQDNKSKSKPSGEQKNIEVVAPPIDENVFTRVEQMPQYPGGEKKMMAYLAKNIKYPKDAHKEGVVGTVVCRFVVSKTGEVKDAVILRSAGASMDQEAIRVVNAMPQWVPGKQGGKAVDVYYTLPIRFESDETHNKQSEVIPDDVIIKVDGKEVTKEEFGKILPETIEQVDVLKSEKLILITLKK